MKNLSLETCIRLKDAGFPQPERAPGQLWYAYGELCLIVPDARYGTLAASLECNSKYGTNAPENWVYCPTALELLGLLPDWELRLSGEIGKWMLDKYDLLPFNSKLYAETAERLVERLAEIWLSENEQKTNEQ